MKRAQRAMVFIMLAAMLLLCGVPAFAAGTPLPFPAAYWGSVKSLADGSQIAAGTVEAIIDGKNYGSINISDGIYGAPDAGIKLLVQGADLEGKTVYFKVNGVDAAQTALWSSGTVTRVDLTANVGEVTPPALSLAAGNLPGGTVGKTYNYTFNVTGGQTPYSFVISAGSLSAGLSLSGGAITGTPTSYGSCSFTVKVTDLAGQQATQSFSLTISKATGGGTINNDQSNQQAGQAASNALRALAGSGVVPAQVAQQLSRAVQNIDAGQLSDEARSRLLNAFNAVLEEASQLPAAALQTSMANGIASISVDAASFRQQLAAVTQVMATLRLADALAAVSQDVRPQVVINVPSTAGQTAFSVQLPTSDLADNEAAQQAVVVIHAGDINFALPLSAIPGAFNSGNAVQISVSEVASAQVADSLAAVGGEPGATASQAGKIYEFNISLVNSTAGTDTPVTSFQQSYRVTMGYQGNATNPTVWTREDANSPWTPVPMNEVQVDLVTRTVTMERSSTSFYAILDYHKTFADIAGHWARQDIEKAASKFLVYGVRGNSFAPDKNVTRAEFAAMLVRLLGLKGGDSGPGFSDVPKDAWYAGAVSTAVSNGLASGMGDGVFGPNKLITREQMATMLARALARAKMKPAPLADPYAVMAGLSDKNLVSGWANESVALLLQEKVMSGRGAGIFAPGENTTRAEAAVVLNKLQPRY